MRNVLSIPLFVTLLIVLVPTNSTYTIHLSYSRRFHDGRVPTNYCLRRCHLARSLQPSRPSVDDQLVLPGNRGPCYDVMRGVRLHPNVHVSGALLDHSIPFQVTEGLFYNGISSCTIFHWCLVGLIIIIF